MRVAHDDEYAMSRIRGISQFPGFPIRYRSEEGSSHVFPATTAADVRASVNRAAKSATETVVRGEIRLSEQDMRTQIAASINFKAFVFISAAELRSNPVRRIQPSLDKLETCPKMAGLG
jgi:hypothetical protein